MIINGFYNLTTALWCIEDDCLGYTCAGASTVTNWPLDSITLPWLVIPEIQPWALMQSSRHPSHWVDSRLGECRGGGGGGGRKTLMSRPKMTRKLLNPMRLVQWWSALSLQYHTNSADRKYQLLFLVKLNLTAFIVPFFYCTMAYELVCNTGTFSCGHSNKL